MSENKDSEADVTRLADMLRASLDVPLGWEQQARHLLNQGVTLPPLPPDPAVVVAAMLRMGWDDCMSTESILRGLFTTEALAAAAAKLTDKSVVQEADRG